MGRFLALLISPQRTNTLAYFALSVMKKKSYNSDTLSLLAASRAPPTTRTVAWPFGILKDIIYVRLG
jgi:hypothetical protein